jgi:hypothetical protein
MLPFANSAHGVRQSAQVGQNRHHRYHSRAWWRRYRARLRAKRAAALAHRNALLGLPTNIPVSDLALGSTPPVTAPATTPTTTEATTPATTAAAPAEMLPVVKSPTAKLPGQMNLAVVALSRPNPAFLTSREESKMLAGVNVSDLRRLVIDKMVVAGGWVTNDFVREINGARVFVVTARTPKDARSPEKAWTFYFTESGGRIYGLTTDSAVEYADRMTTEAERFIATLRAKAETSKR